MEATFADHAVRARVSTSSMSSHNAPRVIDIHSHRQTCRDCRVKVLCLPLSLCAEELEQFDHIVKRPAVLSRGNYLYRTRDRFRAIYAIRAGSLKTFTLSGDGCEQITGFHLPGDLVGLDAIAMDRHRCAAQALETTSICEIPYDRLEEIGGAIPNLQKQLMRLMSRTIVSDEEHLVVLAKKSAEQRLVTLLVNFARRLRQRGLSAHEFYLSMSRGDIGNYLGLSIETVSRLFTRLQDLNLIAVEHRLVRIHDLLSLQRLTAESSDSHESWDSV